MPQHYPSVPPSLPRLRGKSLFLLAALLLCASGHSALSQEFTRPARDAIGTAWTFSIHFKGEQDLEVIPERVRCSLQAGSGKAFIANGKPDEEASDAFGAAVASLQNLAPLGYPLPSESLSGLDITLTYGKGEFPHLGAGQSLAQAVAAYSILTSTPVLGDVALAGTVDEAGKIGAIESVDLLVQSAAQHPLSTIILPAENQPQIDLLPKELRLKIRVVLVQNLHQALFYALGPWGPQGQTYLYLLEVYRRAVNCLSLGDFAHADYFFKELALRLPEDTSFPLWFAAVEEKRAESEEKALLGEASALLTAGDLPGARKKIEQALQARPDSQAVKQVFERLVAMENDSQPPQVSASVQDGQEFAPQQEIVVRATDNYGITQVSISIDGEQVAYGNSVPFSATIDTVGLTPGSHVLKIQVADPAGNVSALQSAFVVPTPASG